MSGWPVWDDRVRELPRGDVLGDSRRELSERVRVVSRRDDLGGRRDLGGGVWVRRWNL